MTNAEAIERLTDWLGRGDYSPEDATELERAVVVGIEALRACQRAEFTPAPVTPRLTNEPSRLRAAPTRRNSMTVKQAARSIHAKLVEIAARWLKRQGCDVVLTERNAGGECPDAIGWYCQGFTSAVVECKASVADFRADQGKKWRHVGMGGQRWYLIPKGLLTDADCPASWGLLEWTGKRVRVVRQAPKSPDRRDTTEEAKLLLSELRIYHAQGIEYRKGAERWKPVPDRQRSGFFAPENCHCTIVAGDVDDRDENAEG